MHQMLYLQYTQTKWWIFSNKWVILLITDKSMWTCALQGISNYDTTGFPFVLIRFPDFGWLFHDLTTSFNSPLSGTTQVGQYQKGKTNLDFTEARDSEWQWHQLGHMQICTSPQTDNHASTLSIFLQAWCPSCRQSNSVKALKAQLTNAIILDH